MKQHLGLFAIVLAVVATPASALEKGWFGVGFKVGIGTFCDVFPDD